MDLKIRNKYEGDYHGFTQTTIQIDYRRKFPERFTSSRRIETKQQISQITGEIKEGFSPEIRCRYFLMIARSYMSASKVFKYFILICIIFIGGYVLIMYIYPISRGNNNLPSNATLEWQGTISNKTWNVVGDHEEYYFQINGTSQQQLVSIGYYNEFQIGDYVYCYNVYQTQIITKTEGHYH